MPRSARIAGIAALAGMMMAVVAIGVTMPAAPPPAATVVPVATVPDALARELDRCAKLTMPDAGCEAAWAANRRRFFGGSDAQP